MTILVVDDDKGIRRVICLYLRDIHEADLIEACNGKEALEWLQGSKADLVVTDYKMPEMNGSELIRRIRQNSEMAEVPVILFSGEVKTLMNYVKDSNVWFLQKPEGFGILTETVCSLLQKDDRYDVYLEKEYHVL